MQSISLTKLNLIIHIIGNRNPRCIYQNTKLNAKTHIQFNTLREYARFIYDKPYHNKRYGMFNHTLRKIKGRHKKIDEMEGDNSDQLMPLTFYISVDCLLI